MAVTAYGQSAAKQAVLGAKHAGETINLNARQQREQKNLKAKHQSQSGVNSRHGGI